MLARDRLERRGGRPRDRAGGGADSRRPSRGTGRTRGAPRGRRRRPPRPRARTPGRCCRRGRRGPRTGRGRRAGSAWADGTRRHSPHGPFDRASPAGSTLTRPDRRARPGAQRRTRIAPPWRPDLVSPASQPAPPWSAPPVEVRGSGADAPSPGHRGRTDPPEGGHHALPEPVHRPAGSRPVRGADRHDRRPHRRDRRPLSARDRASSSAPTGARSSCPGRASSRSTTAARGCGVRTIDITKFTQREHEIRLRVDLLDKQIVDIEGRKVIRVNDVRLDEIEGRLRVVAVDVGAAGLVRRLGVEGPFRTIARGLRRGVPERYIDWEDVDPLDSTIASVRLRVPHARLAELHPADLADIIDQLTPRDRLGVLASLDDEAARRRRRGDGARHAGRGARGPRARARRRHPRGDEPGRRGRPRRRPRRTAAATRSSP